MNGCVKHTFHEVLFFIHTVCCLFFVVCMTGVYMLNIEFRSPMVVRKDSFNKAIIYMNETFMKSWSRGSGRE